MTVEYNVPAANSGMAALFSSGSAEITVSAEFKLAIVEGDPNTWPLDDQNNLVAPDTLKALPSNIKDYITGDITGIDLSGCTELTTIDYQAFSGCDGLTSIDLSDCTSLTTIGQSAFEDCSKLTSITLSGCTDLQIIGPLCI